MSKSEWGTSAYRGKPDPAKIANRIMLVVISLLLVGFVKAGLREDWFNSTIEFIMS